MRPVDLERELERLTVDAATTRERLAELRPKLARAREVMEELRRIIEGRGEESGNDGGVPGEGAGGRLTMASDSTTRAAGAQEEAKAG